MKGETLARVAIGSCLVGAGAIAFRAVRLLGVGVALGVRGWRMGGGRRVAGCADVSGEGSGRGETNSPQQG